LQIKQINHTIFIYRIAIIQLAFDKVKYTKSTTEKLFQFMENIFSYNISSFVGKYIVPFVCVIALKKQKKKNYGGNEINKQQAVHTNAKAFTMQQVFYDA
jgi:hypothetical protein